MDRQVQEAEAEDGVKILYFILTRAQAHKDKEGMCLFIGKNERKPSELSATALSKRR